MTDSMDASRISYPGDDFSWQDNENLLGLLPSFYPDKPWAACFMRLWYAKVRAHMDEIARLPGPERCAVRQRLMREALAEAC